MDSDDDDDEDEGTTCRYTLACGILPISRGFFAG